MTEARNRCWRLRRYPEGVPGPENFSWSEEPVPSPGPGEALLRTLYLSLDPFPRMQITGRAGGPPQVALGEVMIGRGVCRIVESRRPDLPDGALVAADPGWAEYALLPAGAPAPRIVDPSFGPPAAALGLLGPSGLAAFAALTHAGQAAAGETIAVTAAAGSVGLAACQIARLLGAGTVLGLARGAVQCGFVRERLDAAAIDIEAADFAEQLRAAAGEGIHLALDTVGGHVHEALLGAMRPRGRVVMAGFIAAYGGERPRYTDPYAVVLKRLTLTGFLLADHAAHADAGLARLGAWWRDGKLRIIEHVTDGLEHTPQAWVRLFEDAPPGKQIVRVAAEETTE